MRKCGWASLEWDISKGQQYYLSSRRKKSVAIGWQTTGLIGAMQVGTPFASFSRARDIHPGPMPSRSDALPNQLCRSVRTRSVGCAHR